MKSTKEIQELIAKDNAKLFLELEELNKKLATERFDVSFRKLKNIKSISGTRKRIARIWTIINARVIEEINKVQKAAK